MKKIGFIGPFCDLNFGDYAMLINNILSLGEQDYTVFSCNAAVIENVISYNLGDYRIKVGKQ